MTEGEGLAMTGGVLEMTEGKGLTMTDEKAGALPCHCEVALADRSNLREGENQVSLRGALSEAKNDRRLRPRSQ